jgi:hypothetical protein
MPGGSDGERSNARGIHCQPRQDYAPARYIQGYSSSAIFYPSSAGRTEPIGESATLLSVSGRTLSRVMADQQPISPDTAYGSANLAATDPICGLRCRRVTTHEKPHAGLRHS